MLFTGAPAGAQEMKGPDNMLAKNMGTIDRVLRLVIGAALIAAFFLNPDAGYRWLYLIGIVPLATALMGSCPAYSIFGIKTCKTD